jgi:RNA polymerase sigma factor (TIGR02999 family)
VKRGAGVKHFELEEGAAVAVDRASDLVALDDAMNALARLDPRKVQIIEMRFFGGLSVEETAEVLKVSPATVRRDWSIAKFWLYRELNAGPSDESGRVETAR